MNSTLEPLLPRLSTLLVEREAELRAHLDADDTSALQPADDNDVSDFKDVAAQESLSAVEDVQAAHVAAELALVVAARRRLADGTYGSCTDCDAPIDTQRLLAVPATARCVSCQAIVERSPGRQSGASVVP
ncbi:TraR/DksA family transcriptional regulator [Caenimonas sedimenti]|uniref:TraR/DksA family transcriptional regulator n=1 Tax=Caenimonas sedimenti TaxID=2596921 RepID=A0A562ZWG3_9BURK|nr:TraR/DksA family transcriptional regulator [Caenimonas sedimenti]TWO72711.1 TraR/DksA family transcriptional regulator [Caenimonas sedimenti]